MDNRSNHLSLTTLANSEASRSQRGFAIALCVSFSLLTAALVPIASRMMPLMPGFVACYQTALIVVYALTSYLCFTQYHRSRSVPLLLLAAGSFYTTLIVFAQLLSFPNIFAQGRMIGESSDSAIWLWTFWHIGPPLFALPYAVLQRGGRSPEVQADAAIHHGWIAALTTLLVVALMTILVDRYVFLLPKNVEGDNFTLLFTTGVGPAVLGLTILALGVLVWATRVRTVLQLWLAVSLFLLVVDSIITFAGADRGTIGWFAGRLEALAAGIVVLGVYLREVDFLYGRAESIAAKRERERAALQLARDHLATALEAADMGGWEFDVSTDTSRRTPRHDRIFGYDQPLPRWGRTEFFEHIVPEDRAAAESAFEQAFKRGALEIDCRITRAGDGAVRWIAARGRAGLDAQGEPALITGVIMDTTERRQTEERLRLAQKMEAIGQLSGGIAHDFNNLLTIIIGNLDMVSRKPDNAQRVSRLAASSMKAAHRGAELTQKLLAFSRRQVLRPETVNPNGLLKEFTALLRRAIGEAITLELDLDPSLSPAHLDPGQFESAILNLAVNARDAMPSGGTLRVRTSNAVLTASDPSAPPDGAPGNYVAISVSDTGSGMDETTLGRVFEPFFTTKDVGKGTGLGLSQVYGFVTQAGGHVRIASDLGRGTTVTLYLPRSAERPGEASEDLRHVTLPYADDGEVVLAVEDEAAVLEMAVESLAELGYQTRTAIDAAGALDVLRGDERIDILFSDIIMPGGMNGVQLCAEARRLRPGLRILLTSGYTGGGPGGHGVPEDLPLLTKPYLREDLAHQLRLALNAG